MVGCAIFAAIVADSWSAGCAGTTDDDMRERQPVTAALAAAGSMTPDPGR